MNAVCPNDNIVLTYENSHVAYIGISFDEIFNDFLKNKNLQVSDIALLDPDANDNDQRGIISNQELYNKWINFHDKLSNLKLLSAHSNLRRH